MELLEDGVPDPPPGSRFTLKQRKRLIRDGSRLPPAWRVPTERSLHDFLQGVLCTPALFDVLQTFRKDHPCIMERIVSIVLRELLPEVPESRRCHLKRVVRGTLLSDDESNYYSLVATERRLCEMDYEECCARCVGTPPRPSMHPNPMAPALANRPRTQSNRVRHLIVSRVSTSRRLESPAPRSDHYTSGSYGKRFHAYVIYRYILFMRKKSEKLRGAIEETATCAVCLHRAARVAAEGGDQVIWRQAEPCRHWTCDSCTRDLAVRGLADKCSQCRGTVISYALAVAPGGNQV